MAKKTNKTDHVLNLLSSGKEEKDSGTSAQPPVDPGKDASVSVVQPSSENERFADTIKRSLEEELEEMESDVEKTAAEEPVTEEPAAEATVTEEPETEASEAETSEAETSEAETPAAEEPVTEAPVAETPAAVSAAKKERPQEQAETEEPEFASINVMEVLVKESVMDYMTQFGICTCPRCAADTAALALSQLPPKYVVVNKEAVSPLMNFYAQKYAGQITVEITKACIKVGDVPHHARK